MPFEDFWTIFFIFYGPQSEIVWQLLRKLVYKVSHARYQVPFYWKRMKSV